MRKLVLLASLVALGTLLAGGTAFADHIGGLHVTLSPDNETKPVYSEHTVTARVSSISGPVPGATVNFEIGGPYGTSSFQTSTDGNDEAPSRSIRASPEPTPSGPMPSSRTSR